MYCEFCQESLEDLAQVRRHTLTVKHSRNRKNHELSKDNLMKNLHQAYDHPNSLEELITLLSLSSTKDVRILDDAGFFEIKSKSTSNVIRAMIPIIFQNLTDYHLENLPTDVKRAILASYAKHKSRG